MRVSCRKDDAGYLPWRRLKAPTKVEVFLDGDLLREVITADEAEGFVLVWAKDEDGKHRLNEARDGFLTERRDGRVRIFIPESA